MPFPDESHLGLRLVLELGLEARIGYEIVLT